MGAKGSHHHGVDGSSLKVIKELRNAHREACLGGSASNPLFVLRLCICSSLCPFIFCACGLLVLTDDCHPAVQIESGQGGPELPLYLQV
eukprot:scaffold46170_cov18-Tisochrysis_lutea.AAC.5